MKSEAGRKSWEAARVLSEYDDPPCVEAMLEMISSSNMLIGSIAINALEMHLSPDLMAKMVDTFSRCSGSVQLQIVDLVEQNHYQEAVQPLAALLRSNPSPSLCAAIIQALG